MIEVEVAPDAEVLEEAIMAGLTVLWTYDPDAGEDRQIVTEMFQAMLRASRRAVIRPVCREALDLGLPHPHWWR